MNFGPFVRICIDRLRIFDFVKLRINKVLKVVAGLMHVRTCRLHSMIKIYLELSNHDLLEVSFKSSLVLVLSCGFSTTSTSLLFSTLSSVFPSSIGIDEDEFASVSS